MLTGGVSLPFMVFSSAIFGTGLPHDLQDGGIGLSVWEAEQALSHERTCVSGHGLRSVAGFFSLYVQAQHISVTVPVAAGHQAAYS